MICDEDDKWSFALIIYQDRDIHFRTIFRDHTAILILIPSLWFISRWFSTHFRLKATYSIAKGNSLAIIVDNLAINNGFAESVSLMLSNFCAVNKGVPFRKFSENSQLILDWNILGWIRFHWNSIVLFLCPSIRYWNKDCL